MTTNSTSKLFRKLVILGIWSRQNFYKYGRQRINRSASGDRQSCRIKEGIIEDGAPALLLSPGIKLIRQARWLLPQGDRQPLTVISYQLSVSSLG